MDFSIVGQNYDVRAAIETVQTWRRSPARIHLVGASFGAPPAIFGALKFTSSVASVFLISPILSYQKTFIEPRTEWATELFSREKRNQLDRTGKLYMDSAFCIGHRLFGEIEVIQPDRAPEFLGALVNRCVKKFRQQQPSTTPLPCLHLQIERPGEPLASAPVR